MGRNDDLPGLADKIAARLATKPQVLLIHPAGATAATWGAAANDLGQVARVPTYDRRGYRRSGGEPVYAIPTHTADAAALL